MFWFKICFNQNRSNCLGINKQSAIGSSYGVRTIKDKVGTSGVWPVSDSCYLQWEGR